ncbi:hypothetical protein CR513_62080, partial [Mucuna pruriens]
MFYLTSTSKYKDKSIGLNYHVQHAKKYMFLNLVCFEFNLTLVPKYTWWINSIVSTHINMSIQMKKYIYVDDKR